MNIGITIGAAVAICSACQAGTPFTVSSASYSVSAIAQGEFSESDSSTVIGPVGMSVGERVAGQYDVDSALSGFISEFIRVSMSASSITFGSSSVACSTQTNGSVVFSVPAEARAILRSEGNGSAGWQAIAGTDATASFSASLTGAGGALIQRSAADTPEVFIASVNLPAGEYTLSVSAVTTSSGDPTTAITAVGVITGGVRLDITAGFGPCNAADLAEPFAVLDLADINAFVSGFTTMDPAADIDGDGLFDLADINAFVASFVAGCG